MVALFRSCFKSQQFRDEKARNLRSSIKSIVQGSRCALPHLTRFGRTLLRVDVMQTRIFLFRLIDTHDPLCDELEAQGRELLAF